MHAVGRALNARYGHAVDRQQRGDPAANITKCAKTLQMRYPAGQNIAGHQPIQIFSFTAYLRLCPGEVRKGPFRVFVDPNDCKADRPPHTRDQSDIPHRSLAHTVGAFLIEHHAVGVLKPEMQPLFSIERKGAAF